MVKRFYIVLLLLLLCNCIGYAQMQILPYELDLNCVMEGYYYKYPVYDDNYCLIRFNQKKNVEEITIHTPSNYLQLNKTNFSKNVIKYYQGLKNSNYNGFNIYTNKGKLESVSYKKEGQPIGQSFLYDDKTGLIFLIRRYNENGQPISWYEYHDELILKAHIEFCYEDKKEQQDHFCFERRFFKNGIVSYSKETHQDFITISQYFDNGQLQYTDTLDKYSGKYYKTVRKYLEYYSDGTISQDIDLLNGVFHGMKMQYYPDGKLKTKMYFENGKLNGDFFKYNSKGEIIIHDVYKDDKMISKCRKNIFHRKIE